MDDDPTAVSERPLRADARRNRDALLAAAVEAFAKDGADVPLETIAANAGVGVGTLYRNFPDRNALIEAAYRHEVEELCERAPQLLATRASGLDALREWTVRFIGYAAAKAGMKEALRASIGAEGSLFSETRELIVTALGELLAAGAKDGSIRADVDAGDVWRAMGAVWNVPSGPQWERHVRTLLDLVLDGLRYGAREQS
ncbi:MAG TPA: TetR/AcrR family transcriptional regulator [Cellulomonas sp.]